MTRRVLSSLVLAASIVGLLAGCGRSANVKDDKGKYSYALGHQIGNNMKSQNIELDINSFAVGLEKALKGDKTIITDEEMREAMRKMAEKRQQAELEVAAKNKEKSEAYLAENAKKEGIKSTASGLQYKVLTEGSGKKPKGEEVVEVHYRGKLIDGTEFDSSHSRGQPSVFPVKAVIPGWTEALQMMPVGSKWELYIPPNLAYGERGNARIPGNSVLVFEVELLGTKKQ
jgi:FKBP-type peptidyl-prolyl cis-trans isomerase